MMPSANLNTRQLCGTEMRTQAFTICDLRFTREPPQIASIVNRKFTAGVLLCLPQTNHAAIICDVENISRHHWSDRRALRAAAARQSESGRTRNPRRVEQLRAAGHRGGTAERPETACGRANA